MSVPPAQPDRDEQIRQVIAYLEQHRAQYDLSALRKQLLDAGYLNTVVDEALRRLDGGNTAAPRSRAGLFGFLWSLANWVLLFVVGAGAGVVDGNGLIPLVTQGMVLVIELALVVVLWSRPGSERVSRILLWTVIWTILDVVLLFVVAALLVGACLAIYGTSI
jgi:hypothetical protein